MYSVRSGYAIALDLLFPGSSSSSSNATQIYWKKLWSAPAIPRTKELVWRACNGIVPVKELLRHRRIINDDICPCCGLEVETIYHELVSCEDVKGIWFASSLGIRGIPSESAFSNWFQSNFLQFGNKEATGLACELIWVIWCRRNAWNFNGIKQDVRHVLNYASSIHCPFETDCLRIVQAWNQKRKILGYWQDILNECREDAAHLDAFSISFTGRSCNKVTHFLASFSFSMYDHVWLDDFPPSLMDLIYADVATSFS
ncbi:hypothetical protein RIF29_24206 [Crotalaria pallida]|uniref:Reverse transcriptase zinc-binding domain-containing protein n=1 Tax=Crotalaria pallida TaxID=3830 RepID=A0AAN9HZY3_CROPI